MATDSVPRPFRWVCLVPELLQVFFAQYLCCRGQMRDFTIFNCLFFQSFGWEALNEAFSYSTFIIETRKLLLLGTVCKCVSADAERSVTVLLVFLVSRSTSIWFVTNLPELPKATVLLHPGAVGLTDT